MYIYICMGPRFYTGHSAAVNSVAWNLDGSLLMSASADRTVFFFFFSITQA